MTYISVTEAARRAGCSRRYILAEIQRQTQGKPGLRAEKVGATYIISEQDFDKWLANPRRGERSKRK